MKIPTKTRRELQYGNSTTGLVRLSERVLLSIGTKSFSPVDRDEIHRNKIVSSPVTYTKLIRKLLKWKYIQSKSGAIFQKCFVCLRAYGKILLPVTEISVAGCGRLLIRTHRNFYEENIGKVDFGKTEPERLTGLI